MNTSETTLIQDPSTSGHPGKPAPSLAITSIGLGIPITAICLGTTGGGTSGIVAMLIAWGGIAAVNLAPPGAADSRPQHRAPPRLRQGLRASEPLLSDPLSQVLYIVRL